MFFFNVLALTSLDRSLIPWYFLKGLYSASQFLGFHNSARESPTPASDTTKVNSLLEKRLCQFIYMCISFHTDLKPITHGLRSLNTSNPWITTVMELPSTVVICDNCKSGPAHDRPYFTVFFVVVVKQKMGSYGLILPKPGSKDCVKLKAYT